MARRSAIRASDDDRELVAERLREATGEGRLLPGELEDRLGAAFAARTHGELAVLVSDLPGPGRGRAALPIWARASLGVAGAVGVVAAAAVAAFLFALIACLSAAWVVVTRAMSGRGGRVRSIGQEPARTLSAHRGQSRSGITRGGRALLP